MTATKFEIRIAVVGFVAVGKTTVLNALFRDKYGEVSNLRTTAGANHFRISSRSKTRKIQDDDSMCSAAGKMQKKVAPHHQTAATTLKEITQDNVVFRSSDKVHEKFFDIELDEELVEMRDDVRLVVIDIPGVNEAGAGSKYKDYVADKWNTFDCVVVVVDGKQGVNSEEQVSFLQFVKTCTLEKNDIPVIILCNKVDDPDDEELDTLVVSTQEEVQRIFEVQDRQAALQEMVSAASQPRTMGPRPPQEYPVFIPISAIHAFIYQTASHMTLEQFKRFDRDLIEKLGREEVGRFKWKKLSEEKKYQETHEIVSNPEDYEERLGGTNFDKFLKALSYTVGGAMVQGQILEHQLEMARTSLSYNSCIAMQLKAIYERCEALGKSTASLREDFWRTYKRCEKDAMLMFEEPDDVKHLSGPMTQLIEYHRFVCEVQWKDEEKVVFTSMKKLVLEQYMKFFNEESTKRYVTWTLDTVNEDEALTWNSMSPEDWKTICRSILLLSYDKYFCEEFGPEKILLESLVDKINRTGMCYLCGNKLTSSETEGGCKCRQSHRGISFEVKDGRLVNVKANQEFDQVYQIEPPRSLSDPSHWGHLTWKFCGMMEASDTGLH